MTSVSTGFAIASYPTFHRPNIFLSPLIPKHTSTHMSPVPPPAKALVTGANGYIAVWVVRYLLEEGYAVRGVVRSASKGAHLKKIFAEHGNQFELAVVEDMTKVRARACRGREGIPIYHPSSPVHSMKSSRAWTSSSTQRRRSTSVRRTFAPLLDAC
jgi:hypothetical protein